jgi:hypothetical protein
MEGAEAAAVLEIVKEPSAVEESEKLISNVA